MPAIKTKTIEVTYSLPNSAVRHVRVVHLPTDAKKIRAGEVFDVPEPLSDEGVVQCLFPGGSQPYCYLCPGAEVGEDVVVLTPHGTKKVVRVVALGRGTGHRRFTGEIHKTAMRLVDPTDDER